MKILEQKATMVKFTENPLYIVAKAYRTCYRSTIRPGYNEVAFVRGLIKKGHETPLEHVSATFELLTDRGVMAEITRHRTGIAFSVQSTRYVRQDRGVEFIRPVGMSKYKDTWHKGMALAEAVYLDLLGEGAKPEQARSVLPNSTATRIIVTANLREWMHIMKLRTHKTAHPQMRELMFQVQNSLTHWCPWAFEGMEV